MEQQTSAERRRRAMILEAQGDASRPCCALNRPSRWVNGAIIEKGMETLKSIGEGESTTFVLPQELSSLVGRYGKHLTGSDLRVEDGQFDSLDFGQETQEMLGLDNLAELIGEIDEGAELDLDRPSSCCGNLFQGFDFVDTGIEPQLLQVVNEGVSSSRSVSMSVIQWRSPRFCRADCRVLLDHLLETASVGLHY